MNPSGLIIKLKHNLVCVFYPFVPAGPAPVPSPTLFSPPRTHSTPPNRSRGRRQPRDITPPTPSSTRTLNCSASRQHPGRTRALTFSHTHHSILFCTKILLLTLNWLLLSINGFGEGGRWGAFFFCSKEVEQLELSLWRGNLMSSLFPLLCLFLYALRLRLQPERMGASCFLAYATLQFVHSNWNFLPRFLPSQKPQLKTHNALYHICTCFFLKLLISHYKQQMLHRNDYILHIQNTNIYIYIYM